MKLNNFKILKKLKDLIIEIISSFPVFLLIITVFTSCNKDEDINKIDGTLSSYPFNEKVANAEVILSAKMSEQGSFSNSYEKVSTQFTDNNGAFDFEFDKQRAQSYRITVNHDDYRFSEYEFLSDGFTTQKTVHKILVKKSNLTIAVANINPPVSESDEFKIRIKGITEYCQDCSTNEFVILEGADIDTSLVFETAGNDSVEIEYVVDKNETKYFSNTIYCQTGNNFESIVY